MFKNWIITVARNMVRQKGYYSINILGLSIGIAATLFICLWINDELSVDRFHSKSNQTYLLYKKYMIGGKDEFNSSTPYLLGRVADEKVAEIGIVTRVARTYANVSNGAEIFNETRICATDPGFFECFDYKFLSGSPESALSDPYAVTLTRSVAIKYFGTIDAIGLSLTIGDSEYVVYSVIEDMPANTRFQYTLFLRIESIVEKAVLNDWKYHFIDTYYTLADGADPGRVNSAITSLVQENMSTEYLEFHSMPVSRLHLYTFSGRNNRVQYVYLFSLIGALLIIMASINYINVFTSLSIKRSHEIGIRKVMGARRKQVMIQFLGESLIHTTTALAIGISLVEILRPVFNEITGKVVVIPYLSLWFILVSSGLLVLVTILSGIYPAMLVSSSDPAEVFRGRTVIGKDSGYLRKVLVVFQISISIILVISTLLINNQIKYMINKDMGFDTGNLVYLHLEEGARNSYDILRTRLLEHPGIKGVTRCSNLPSEVYNILRDVNWEGKEEDEMSSSFGYLACDFEFPVVTGMRLSEGRFFSKDMASDSSAYIVNRRAVEYMGMDDPIGKMYNTGYGDDGPIIGVVENFNSLPLNNDYEPLIMTVNPQFLRIMLVRLDGKQLDSGISHLVSVWSDYVPDVPARINFLEESIERSYRMEQRVSRLAGAFTLLAIIISCIGLFGLASHNIQEKSREIVIRKVMGASEIKVLMQLLVLFFRRVVLAVIIAWPLAWLLFRSWVQNYAFRARISIWIFMFAFVIALLITLISVGTQAYIAAVSNPAERLRRE